jgi:putative YhdH/YhfP family quinone oxidoreductase
MSQIQHSTSRCFVVEKNDDVVSRSIRSFATADLEDRAIKVKVLYSSLNYKDALASSGHPGVVREFPRIPGIDAVGEVIQSKTDEILPGQMVLVGNADFGTNADGGWADVVNVPANWVWRLPENMSPQQSMALGTAGFTAAGCVSAMLLNGAEPAAGEVIVTGATGGVGSLAVMLLSKLGFDVVASTGKPDRHQWLEKLGATRVIDREQLNNTEKKPLLSALWAGGVDTVGGNTLGTVLRQTKIGGTIAACGVVAGPELPITVYPFILRGVTLCGIDSANTPKENRIEIWNKLANEWQLPGLEELTNTVTLDELEPEIEKILAGKIVGRTVIRLNA